MKTNHKVQGWLRDSSREEADLAPKDVRALRRHYRLKTDLGLGREFRRLLELCERDRRWNEAKRLCAVEMVGRCQTTR